MRLEELEQGTAVDGIVPETPVTILAVTWHGSDAVAVVYSTSTGRAEQAVLYRADEASLARADHGMRPYDAPADDFKLAAEAQRIRLAGLFDPMLAVTTSEVTPLPHQIRAVYGELLPRKPLRFLLADDPGAGKTIMAGLLIKELVLRDDVKRCLVVAPGGLVEQWQDELYLKFGLRFTLLTNPLVDGAVGQSVFDAHPLLIARMDQLSRNDALLEMLRGSSWDLVVVDEAHRMAVHWYGGKLEKTRRFELGEELGRRTRHLLLMTATPHTGIEDDFQAFLSLLDRDEFQGRGGRNRHTDLTRFMRRMIKEDLLTFEGKPLFPERRAETIPYELSPLEQHLYDEVTAYVREGMGRADTLDDPRRRTVGFALTVLQRRLASSPAAIHQSLIRRAARLRARVDALVSGGTPRDAMPYAAAALDLDPDEASAAELENAEEELVDAATAARTEAELRIEIAQLDGLIELAARVRASTTDVKWAELRTILEGNVLVTDAGTPRKLIVFTEHRDTLDYLVGRIGTLLGDPEAVVAMHGGVRRDERRRVAEEFTKNPQCRILVATDAAGEGLNLQAAHLMVNYDLPWNPNRIEQRFGRIHRIGQTEVCRLWNLVAVTTREGEVFKRLLDKVAEQRSAYGGRIFDVLGGGSFDRRPLRDLLLEAIRHGERPEVRARMHEVIDAGVSDGLHELLTERALAREVLTRDQVDTLRHAMDEARVRRLQPYYIEMAFRAAFSRLGGRMARRERGRYEISRVPPILLGRRLAVASRYERVTFEISAIDHPSSARADLLAPGHPLHDAVMEAASERWGPALDRGTVLVGRDLTEPRVLVGVQQEVVDGTGEVVGRRFGYAYADSAGSVSDAPPAPYLDCVGVADPEVLQRAHELPWLASAERAAVSWLVANSLPAYLDELAPRRRQELDQARAAVQERLGYEIIRLGSDALAASAKEASGTPPRESSNSLTRKANELERRLELRLAQIARQESMRTPPPRIIAAAIVVPEAWLDAATEDEVAFDVRARDTEEVERRGVEAALAAERVLGRRPEEMARNNKGFDIRSEASDGSSVIIEVKARIVGAESFFVTHSEVMAGRNAGPQHRLVLVRVDPRGPEHDEVRYLSETFRGGVLDGLFDVGVLLDWNKYWAAGSAPF